MKKAIKSFWAFTSLGYRLVMLLLIPALVILLNVLGLREGGEVGGLVTMMLSYFVLLFVDIFSDKWLLNGFYAKSNSALDFLQTSNAFSPIIRSVVIIDTIRRLLLYVGVYFILILLGVIMLEDTIWYAVFSYLPLYMLVISQATVWITRHFTSWQSVWISSCLASTVVSMGVMAVSMSRVFMDMERWYILLLIVLIILAVLASVGTVWYSLKKVRDSYYDK